MTEKDLELVARIIHPLLPANYDGTNAEEVSKTLTDISTAILPSPEPQKGKLPEKMKIRDMPIENQINCLRNTLNEIIDYLKEREGG